MLIGMCRLPAETPSPPPGRNMARSDLRFRDPRRLFVLWIS